MKLAIRKSGRGVTLIELLLVMILLGILSGLAYPSYAEHLRKSRRGEIQTRLQTAMSRLEALIYRQNISAAQPSDLGLSEHPHYHYALLKADDGLTYRLSATAKNSSPQQQDTGCQTLSIDQQHQKRPVECW